MIKQLPLALAAVLVASCAEGTEPEQESEEAVVKRPNREVTFGAPVEQDAFETPAEGRLKATDIARSSKHLEVKPILEFPQPPAEHETSPIAPTR